MIALTMQPTTRTCLWHQVIKDGFLQGTSTVNTLLSHLSRSQSASLISLSRVSSSYPSTRSFFDESESDPNLSNRNIYPARKLTAISWLMSERPPSCSASSSVSLSSVGCLISSTSSSVLFILTVTLSTRKPLKSLRGWGMPIPA